MDTYENIQNGWTEMFEQAHKNILTDARIRCVIVAYEAALADPKAVIPTALHAAIEGLRRV